MRKPGENLDNWLRISGYLWSVEGELPRISCESGRGALAPRHGECEMRGSESPLTIKAICFEGAIFEVTFHA